MEEAENLRLKLINVVEKSSPISSTQQKLRIEMVASFIYKLFATNV